MHRIPLTPGLLAISIFSAACNAPAPAEVHIVQASSTLQARLSLRLLGRYVAGSGYDPGAAEIVAHDVQTQRLFIVNALARSLDIVDIQSPETPSLVAQLDLSSYGGIANSVAVKNGLVAVAIEAAVKQQPGQAVFFDADGVFLNAVQVGALPDMLTFSPNGKWVLVANEGEPSPDYSLDPEGTVSIIDLGHGVHCLQQSDVRSIGFADLPLTALDPSVRLFGPNPNPAQNFEPEYVAVSHDSKLAYVTLQENNAVAVIDVKKAQLLDVIGLGYKDHSQPGRGLDSSDRDGAIHIANWPVLGMYLPDAIATLRQRGRSYFVTANEGDARDYDAYTEEARVSAVTLDPVAFPDAASLRTTANLGRLKITRAQGDVDGDGDYDRLYSFGARSFSIWSSDGTLVYDSGEDFERITAQVLPSDFNSDNEENQSFDSRSDDKGPEPEAVALTKVRGRTLAFIGLERVGGLMLYDVTNPAAAQFVQYLNSRDFSLDAASGMAGDLGPEGVMVISEDDSPTGKALVVAAHEVSGTTAIYELD